jgi:hypothetical protein
MGTGLLLVLAGAVILVVLIRRGRRDRSAVPYQAWPVTGVDPWEGQ